MDSGPPEFAALVSVHPKFAELILNGRKRVEFRKRRFAESVTHVVIYATRPVQKILGFFEVSAVREDTPSRLWRRYKARGGISRAVFSEYFGEHPLGVAIEVGRVFAFSSPLPLSGVSASATAPQSFCYLRGRVVSKLLRQTNRWNGEELPG